MLASVQETTTNALPGQGLTATHANSQVRLLLLRESMHYSCSSSGRHTVSLLSTTT